VGEPFGDFLFNVVVVEVERGTKGVKGFGWVKEPNMMGRGRAEWDYFAYFREG
jgi:hypothetical protein